MRVMLTSTEKQCCSTRQVSRQYSSLDYLTLGHFAIGQRQHRIYLVEYQVNPLCFDFAKKQTALNSGAGHFYD